VTPRSCQPEQLADELQKAQRWGQWLKQAEYSTPPSDSAGPAATALLRVAVQCSIAETLSHGASGHAVGATLFTDELLSRCLVTMGGLVGWRPCTGAGDQSAGGSWISAARLGRPRCFARGRSIQRSESWRSSGWLITVALVRRPGARPAIIVASPSNPCCPWCGVVRPHPGAQGLRRRRWPWATRQRLWRVGVRSICRADGRGAGGHGAQRSRWHDSPRTIGAGGLAFSVSRGCHGHNGPDLRAGSGGRLMACCRLGLSSPSPPASAGLGLAVGPGPGSRSGWPGLPPDQPCDSLEGLRPSATAWELLASRVEARSNCACAVTSPWWHPQILHMSGCAPGRSPATWKYSRHRLGFGAESGPPAGQPGWYGRALLRGGALPGNAFDSRCSPPGLREQLCDP